MAHFESSSTGWISDGFDSVFGIDEDVRDGAVKVI